MVRALGIVGLLGLMACVTAAGSDDVASDEAAAVMGERVDPAGASLPACASPMMTAIWERSRGVIKNGTVPGRLFATSRNVFNKTPFIEGPQIFGAMADLIASANQEVDFQTYVYEADSDVSDLLVDGIGRLEKRRRSEARKGDAPVIVRMLMDVSSLGIASKVKAVPELARKIDALSLDRSLVDVKLGMFVHRAFGVLHSKTLVADGQHAIITGANPQKHHDAIVGPWFDTAYEVEGEAAQSLLADFDFHWAHKNAKEWVCGGDRDGDGCRRPTEKLTRTFPATQRQDASCLAVIAATRSGDPNIFGNKQDNPQDQAFLAALAASKHQIAMLTPNINDDAFKKGLIGAIAANPEVRADIVLSLGFNDTTENLPGQGGDNMKNVARLYESLAKAGVTDACSRLRIRWYSEDGIVPIDGNGHHASHAKYASFDGEVAIVGSANMDTQSWNNSHESNLVVDSAEVTGSWNATVFDPAFARAIVVEQCAASSESTAQR